MPKRWLLRKLLHGGFKKKVAGGKEPLAAEEAALRQA
jgi:hypothetical protein